MAILGVVTAMLFGVWLALQSSYGFSTKSSRQAETARLAMARLRSEIRDAQGQRAGQPLAGQPAILYATSNEIQLTTAYNSPGSDNTGDIQLVRYWYDGSAKRLYRQRDTNKNGVFDSGDRKDVVAQNVANAVWPGVSNPTPVFSYVYYDINGSAQTASSMSDPSRIVTVKMRLLVDLNPKRAPVYVDLNSSVQPRNLRQT